MICEGTENPFLGMLVPGGAWGQINRLFESLGRQQQQDDLVEGMNAQFDCYFNRPGQADVTGGADAAHGPVPTTTISLASRLKTGQDNVSAMSMYFPSGFAPGLNQQFANLMDEDAWEDGDEFVSMEACTAFLMMLHHARTKRRPGIGTNGRGSITASWTAGDNRLTIECLPSARISLVLSRVGEDGDIERAVFGAMRPERLRQVLAPFSPGVWFDC